MAPVYQQWDAISGLLRSTNFGVLVQANGTNIPVAGLAFDAATDWDAFYKFDAINYGSGNLTVDLLWYAETATTGNVVWGAQLAAITPDTDSQDVETDGLAAAATVIDSHLGTVGKRKHRATITVTALDSLAARDDVALRIYRDADDATNDTMAGRAILERVTVSYSDT